MVPSDAKIRKALPLCTGVLDYFPDALLAVAAVSRVGNEQHNPGQPLHWAKEKSTDEADSLLRHLVDRGRRDTDGTRHSAKVAWRALALLQREIEAEGMAEESIEVIDRGVLLDGQRLRRTGVCRQTRPGDWYLSSELSNGTPMVPLQGLLAKTGYCPGPREILEVVDGDK